MWRTFCFAGFILNATIVVALMGTDQWKTSLYYALMALLFVPGWIKE